MINNGGGACLPASQQQRPFEMCVILAQEEEKEEYNLFSKPACLPAQTRGARISSTDSRYLLPLPLSSLALPMTSARTHVDLLLKAHTGTQIQTQACSQFE